MIFLTSTFDYQQESLKIHRKPTPLPEVPSGPSTFKVLPGNGVGGLRPSMAHQSLPHGAPERWWRYLCVQLRWFLSFITVIKMVIMLHHGYNYVWPWLYRFMTAINGYITMTWLFRHSCAGTQPSRASTRMLSTHSNRFSQCASW